MKPLLTRKIIIFLGFQLHVNTGTTLLASTKFLGCTKIILSISSWPSLVSALYSHNLFHLSCHGLPDALPAASKRPHTSGSIWALMPEALHQHHSLMSLQWGLDLAKHSFFPAAPRSPDVALIQLHTFVTTQLLWFALPQGNNGLAVSVKALSWITSTVRASS